MATTAPHDLVPIQGYDDLEGRHLTSQLRQSSQAELTHIDGYERSHRGRRAVLDKLRWLRGDEPLDGYDRLDANEILAALTDADNATVRTVRNYELKLREREDVLDGLAKLRYKQVTEGSDAAADQPDDERWPGDADGGLKGAAITVVVLALAAVAAALLLVAFAVLVFVVLTAVAPQIL